MIINKIKTCGLKNLYEGYRDSFQENRKAFGSKLYNFMDHVMITLDISDLTTTEIFYLKSFASEVVILNKEYKNFITSDNPEIKQEIENLLNLHDKILKDDDIDKDKAFVDNMLPIGCEQYRVLAIFKGANVSFITGNITPDIFIDKNTNKLYESYPKSSELEEIVSEIFYREFYKYIANKSTELDLVTDYIINKKFYKYADSLCSLAYVHTPLGEITFFGNNSNNLERQINSIKKAQNSIPYHIRNQIFTTYIMKTSFSVFIKIYNNSNFIIDNENFKLLFLKENINLSESILLKYKEELSSYYNPIDEYKKKISEENKINLNMFNFIFNGVEVKYSVKFSLENTDKFINLLDETEDESSNIINLINNTKLSIDTLIG